MIHVSNDTKRNKDESCQLHVLYEFTLFHYKRMSPRQMAYIIENLSYKIGKFTSIVVDLHHYFIDVRQLRRTHMLVVTLHIM